MKKNLFLIVYPMLLFGVLCCNKLFVAEIYRHNVNWLILIIFLICYFTIFVKFIDIFFTSKEIDSKIFIWIGIAELLLLIIVCYINPLNMSQVPYMNDYHNIFIIGIPLSLYIRLLIK